MGKEKTIHLVHVLEAAAGGTLRHVRELSAMLDPRRFRQTLILSPSRDPAHYADNIAPRARVIALPMARRASPVRDLADCFRLARLLRGLAPDVVHAHSSKAGALARVACARLGIPCVYTPHAICLLDTTLSTPRRALYRAVEKRLARKTAAFVALSREEADIARGVLRVPAARVFHIPNGIHWPAAAPGGGRGFAAALEIAFIGRDAPQKGPDIFMRAAGVLEKQFPGLKTTLVTAAPGAAAAWQKARHATVVAIPSRWEGLPYTLLDAMARGKAVAAACVGGIADVLRDGENGLLVEPGNPAALAAACARLLGDPALRGRLGSQALKDARAFSVETMARRHEDMYVDTRAMNQNFSRAGVRANFDHHRDHTC